MESPPRRGRAGRYEKGRLRFFFSVPALDRIERNDSTIEIDRQSFFYAPSPPLRSLSRLNIERNEADDVGTIANRLGNFSKPVASPPAL